MTPTDSVRENKVPLFRKVYGVRKEDGTINGQLYVRSIVSDGLKTIIIALLLAIIGAGLQIYKWYLENKELPQAFKNHCIEQKVKEDKAFILSIRMAEKMGIKIDDVLR